MADEADAAEVAETAEVADVAGLWDALFTSLCQHGESEHHALQRTAHALQNGESGDEPRHLHALVSRGLPSHLRPAAWRAFCGVNASSEEEKRSTLELVDDSESMQRDLRQIDLDVPRVIPREVDHEKLRRILRAFCSERPDVGYCQGMNFVAGTLLHVLSNDEHAAFRCFHTLVLNVAYGWFSAQDGLREATADLLVLEELVQRSLPRVAQTLEWFEVPLASASLGWFLRFFVNSLPFQTVLCVFDLVLCEMSRAPLFRVALALLEHNALQLTLCNDSGKINAFLYELTHPPGDGALLINHAASGYSDVTDDLLDQLRKRHLSRLDAEATDECHANDAHTEAHSITSALESHELEQQHHHLSEPTSHENTTTADAFRRTSRAVKKASIFSPMKKRKEGRSSAELECVEGGDDVNVRPTNRESKRGGKNKSRFFKFPRMRSRKHADGTTHEVEERKERAPWMQVMPRSKRGTAEEPDVSECEDRLEGDKGREGEERGLDGFDVREASEGGKEDDPEDEKSSPSPPEVNQSRRLHELATEKAALEAKIKALEQALFDERAEFANEKRLREEAEVKLWRCTCTNPGHDSLADGEKSTSAQRRKRLSSGDLA